MTDTTKDDAVERLTEFADRSSLSIIDQISMLATGEATVGALVDDIRTVLAEIGSKTDLLDLANETIGGLRDKADQQSAEIERLRAVLSKGLDLSAQARAMGEQETETPSLPMWFEQQYQTNLLDWEDSARDTLKGGA